MARSVLCRIVSSSGGARLRERMKQQKQGANSRFLWAPFARNQALGSHLLIFLGGIVSMWYPSPLIAGVNVGLAVVLIALELQLPPLKYLGFVYRNLYVRTFLHAGAIVPAFIQAPTFTGALCLVLATLTYLRAAINKENPYDDRKPSK